MGIEGQDYQPGSGTTTPAVDSSDADRQPPRTIREALETASRTVGDKPLDVSDSRAIQSAEARATGIATGVRGGVGAAAQSAVATQAPATVGDVLQRHIPIGGDKVVTQTDASYVQSAEARNSETGSVCYGGVAACMQAAADANKSAGYVSPADGGKNNRAANF